MGGVLAAAGEVDAQGGGVGGVELHAVPGEGHPQVTGGERVEGGVEEGGVQGEAVGAGRQDDLGVEVLALLPERGEALEGRPVAVAQSAEALVGVTAVDALGAGGGPGAGVGRRVVGGVVGEGADGVTGPVLGGPGEVGVGVGGVGAGGTRGRSRVSSSRTRWPTWSAACRASSTNAVPGRMTVPNTPWSASQGCVLSDTWPVSTSPSWEASRTAAPSSGCPAGFSPSPAASRTGLAAGSQWRRCWKA